MLRSDFGVAKLAKSFSRSGERFWLKLGIAESLGDFRYCLNFRFMTGR